MLGGDVLQEGLFSDTSDEARVPAEHPLRRIPKRIEDSFGWMKTIGGMRKVRRRGKDRLKWQ